jgi:2-oxoisovalerate dehydrogenase E1 component
LIHAHDGEELMSLDLDQRFQQAVSQLEPLRPELDLGDSAEDGSGSARFALPKRNPELAIALFNAQLGSRHCDFAARWLRTGGHGYHAAESSGHEGNAALAAALRSDDPALLHHRSGAFHLFRAIPRTGFRKAIRDLLAGVAVSGEDPISPGRPRGFGHPDQVIVAQPPTGQPSTGAGALPRALGVAFGISRGRKLGLTANWPSDAVTVCGFGSAAVNHSAAAGAFNVAEYSTYNGMPLSLLLVCEDNGASPGEQISDDWIAVKFGTSPRLRYFEADGTELAQTFEVADQAVRWVRAHRAPAFLHLRMTPLSAEFPARIDTSRDPLLKTAALLVGAGLLTPDQVLTSYEEVRATAMSVAEELSNAPTLDSAAAVMSSLAWPDPKLVAAGAIVSARPSRRSSLFDGALPEEEGPLTLAQTLNRTLTDAAGRYPALVTFGENVAVHGGRYGVTRGLKSVLGAARVFNTAFDEQTILGLASGSALAGLLPVPEIANLAALHRAGDQLRGEVATLEFFFAGQYRNPMVIRVAAYASPEGGGESVPNDNSVAALRDIPGLVIASPSRAADAAPMLRTCLASGSVCVFLEPITLYHTEDLHTSGDRLWLSPYVEPSQWTDDQIPMGAARVYGDGGDLVIVSFANGLWMSLRVAQRLAAEGYRCRVLDLRWLAPLPVEDVLTHAKATGRVLVVDETRRTGGVSEGLLSLLADHGFDGQVARVASEDSFVPFSPAARHVLVDERRITIAARLLLRSSGSPADVHTATVRSPEWGAVHNP